MSAAWPPESRSAYEYLFRNLLEDSQKCFAICAAARDEQGKLQDFIVTEINGAGCQDIRLPREEIAGRRLRDFFSRGAQRTLLPAFERLVETGTPLQLANIHLPQDDRGGPDRWLNVQAVPHEDGFIILWFDASKRPESQAKLDQLRAQLDRQAADQTTVMAEAWESATNFEVALGTAPVVLFSQDDQLRYSWIHQPALWSQQADVLGKTDFDLLPTDAAALITNLKRHVIQSGHAVRQEVTVQAEAEEPRYWDLTIEPLRSSDGKIAGVTGMAVDITEKNRAEQALRESEARYKRQTNELATFYDTAPVGLAVVDQQLRLLQINARLCQLLGCTATSVVGTQITEAISDFGRQLAPLVSHVIETGESRHGVEIRRQDDGELGPNSIWLTSYGPIHSATGAVEAVSIIVEDITERKRNEETVAKSDAELRRLADSVPHHVWSCSPSGMSDYCNSRSLDYLGAAREQVEGVGWLAYIHPDDRKNCRAAWLRAVRDSGDYQAEYRLRRADGEYRWFISHAVQIRNEQGEIIRWYGTSTDVHDRRLEAQRAEENHQRLSAALAASGTGTFRWDLHSGQFQVDPLLTHISGLSTPEDVRTLEDYLQRIHPDDRQEVRQTFEECARSGEDLEVDFRLEWPDGSTRSLSGKARTFFEARTASAYVIGACMDVSGRTVVEQALRVEREKTERSLAQLEGLIANMTEGLVVADPAGRILTMNPAALEMHGFRTLKEARQYLDIPEETFQVEDAERAEIPLEHWPIFRAVKGEKFTNVECHIRRRDIDYYWVGNFGGTPLYDRNGNMTLAIVTVRDITPQKEIEQRLRESEQQFRGSFENAAVGMGHVGFDGRWIRVNQRLCDIVGYSREELQTKSFVDITHPDDIQADMEQFRLQSEGKLESYSMDKRYFHREGHIVWVHLTTAIQRDERGNPQYVISIVQDITERKKYERRLTESEARFRQLADAMPQMVWAADADGALTYVNHRWVQFTGMAPESVVNRVTTWTLAVHPEDRALVEQRWYQALRSGQRLDLQARFMQPGGGPRWHIVRGVPVKNSAGFLVKWFVTCTDIETQKRLQDSLEDAARHKDQFLSMLAHELRNPLAPIRSAVQVLELMDFEDQNLRDMREIIGRQVGHMASLLDDLLDVSRIARGKIQLRRQVVDLAETLQQTSEDHQGYFQDCGLTLHVESTDQPVWVHADPTRLAQVIGNLLHNAGKFTPRGGEVTIELKVDEATGKAEVCIRDTGIGMHESTLITAFEAFRQADTSLDRSQGGLGLGLALVRGLVELHEGDVSAHSAGIGRGTEVSFRLPCVESPLVEVSIMPQQSSSGTTMLRILVIDDRRDVTFTVQRLLEMSGHQVEVAQDGELGLVKARDFAPNVILCDIGLPKMDGYAVAGAIRADEQLRDVFLVALTGYGGEEDRRRAMEAGFDLHLTKPVDAVKLKQVLANLPKR